MTRLEARVACIPFGYMKHQKASSANISYSQRNTRNRSRQDVQAELHINVNAT